MNKIRIIGDVHGKFDEYLKIASDAEYSIQLGDMGFDYEHMESLPMGKHFFIGGNHDNYDRYQYTPYSLKDYGSKSLNGFDFFFVRGAPSIDASYRVVQYLQGGPQTWWYEEELNLMALDNALKLYEKTKPKIVLSHDCPILAKKIMKRQGIGLDLKRFGFKESDIDCNTQRCLQEMFNFHEPDLHFLGHWHEDLQFKIGKTTFFILNELNYLDLSILENNTYEVHDKKGQLLYKTIAD